MSTRRQVDLGLLPTTRRRPKYAAAAEGKRVNGRWKYGAVQSGQLSTLETDTAAVDYCGFHAPQWRQLARCRGDDLGRWFSTDDASVAEAVDCCHGCPVLAACRSDALVAEEGLPVRMRHGIRGAMTPAERVRVRV